MKLLTSKEYASIKKCSEQYVRKLCSLGRIEGAYKLGKMWVIPHEQLENVYKS